MVEFGISLTLVGKFMLRKDLPKACFPSPRMKAEPLEVSVVIRTTMSVSSILIDGSLPLPRYTAPKALPDTISPCQVSKSGTPLRKDFFRNPLLTWDEKVVFAKITSASTNVIGELSLSIYSNLLSFVHSETINIEHSDLDTGEVLNSRADRGFPFAQPILD